jgi:hypothetical protein
MITKWHMHCPQSNNDMYAYKSSVAHYSTAGESLVVLENKNIAMTLTSEPAAGH